MSNNKKNCHLISVKTMLKKIRQQTKTGNAALTGGGPSQTVCGVKTIRKGTHTNYPYIHIYSESQTRTVG